MINDGKSARTGMRSRLLLIDFDLFISMTDTFGIFNQLKITMYAFQVAEIQLDETSKLIMLAEELIGVRKVLRWTRLLCACYWIIGFIRNTVAIVK